MSVIIDSGSTDTNLPMLLYYSIFEDGDVTVSSETADGAGANALEDTTFDFWTPATFPAQITVDYGSAVECDCVGIAAHDAGTNGSTYVVQSSDDGSAWTTRFSLAPLTNDTVLGIFPAISARYWRVRCSTAISSTGVIKLGKRLIIPGGVLSGHVSVNHSHKIELLNNTSIKGQFLGNRILRIGAETEINFGLLETSFVDNDMAVFEAHYNSGRTFFYAGSPLSYPEDYGYCWRPEGADELRPSYQEGGTLMQVDMAVSVYVDQ